MKYLPLYRRLRPQNFNELVGQDAIVRTLKNAIKRNRLSHTYLFSGPKGSGKTSTARIFAKALNCPNKKDGEPCNACAVCNRITQGASLDVLEMDAASHTQVDTVREFIIDKVNFSPVEGKYKVYIIDEAHKLSGSSFDALLKTLEEPPEHIFFILCTTDPQKLPPTIISRCQRYEVRPFAQSEIIAHLRRVCGEEGVQAEEGALGIIASSCDDSLRDALVILEQAISFGEGELTVPLMTQMLGLTGTEAVFSLSEHILRKKTKATLQLYNELCAQGKDPIQLLKDVTDHFRKLLIIKATRDPELLVGVNPEVYQRLAAQVKLTDSAELMRIMKTLMDLKSELASRGEAGLFWEMTLVKLTDPASDLTLQGIHQRLKALEERGAAGLAAQPSVSAPSSPEEEEAAELEIESLPVHKKEASAPDCWEEFLKLLRDKHNQRTLAAILGECLPLETEKDRLKIGVKKNAGFNFNKLTENRPVLQQVWQEINGVQGQVEIVYLGEQKTSELENDRQAGYEHTKQNIMEAFGAKIIGKEN